MSDPVTPPAYDWLQHHEYLLLTTFKRDGSGVPTAVWFGAAGGKLYVYSNATAGKVKRIRATGRVEVCPCSVGGKPTGPTAAGQAIVLPDDQQSYVHGLLNRKYGWKKRVIDITGKTVEALHLRKPQADAVIEVTLN